MNLAQRVVLIAGFVIILVMVLFPPWLFIFKHPALPQSERPAGYHLIFNQGSPEDQQELMRLFAVRSPQMAQLQYFSVRIDNTRLSVQLIGTLLLIAILFFILGNKRQKT